jgi:hypothetical protein
MPSLYELSTNYAAAFNFMAAPENEIDLQTLQDTMEGLDGEVDEKMLNVARFIESIKHEASGIKEVEKRTADRRRVLEKKADLLKDYLNDNMQRIGKLKVSAADISVTLGKCPPSVFIHDESIIPDQFWVISRAISLSAIKAAGGCEGAEILSKGFSLRIK